MMISIIIPVYNAEKYLVRCVRSVQNQSLDNYEIILVDDGSTDTSSEICDDLAAQDTRIKVIHKPNGGVSSARNAGIEIAQGKWLCFFDADDTIPAGALSALTNAAEKFKTDVVIGCHTEISEDGSQISYKCTLPTNKRFNRNEVINNVLIQAISPGNFFGNCCMKMYRRDVLIQYELIFPTRRRAEDWLFNILFFDKAQSAVAIDDVVYNYHKNSNSAMSQCFPEQFEIWEENETIKQNLIAKYGYNDNASLRHTTFIQSAIFYCIQRIDQVKKHVVINDFKRSIFIDAINKGKTKEMLLFIRPVVLLLKNRFYNITYYYLKLLKNAIEAKQRIKRKI